MKKMLALFALLLVASAFAGPAPRTATATADIVAAANAFLASLSREQGQKVTFAFDDATQRARWSNFPTGFVPRAGISLKEMDTAQRAAAERLLSTVLSPMGLTKVNDIRHADNDFKVNGSRRGPPGGSGPPPSAAGGPGGPPGAPPGGPDGLGESGGPGRAGGPSPLSADMFGSDLYYISFLGKPSGTTPWMLQFGGHHLALNITIVGSKNILTPTLTGAQPATFTLNGRTVRPIGRESDKALALVNSLDDNQRSQAVLGYTVADLVLGPGQDGKTIAPEGLKASAMTAAQRMRLLDLITEWSGMMNAAAAATRMAQIHADLEKTWFAWSGPVSSATGTNISAYFRIQGPHLIIEYAPQHDEPANHVHTMYRDPTNDYGRTPTQP